MRLIIFLTILIFVLSEDLVAQNLLQRPRNPDYPGQYESKFLRRSSLMVAIGSGFMNHTTARPGNIGISEISYAYGLTKQFDLGVGLFGTLLCNDMYYDESNLLFSASGHTDLNRCTQAWNPVGTISLFGRYYPVEDIDAFVHGGAGWALRGEAPALHLGAAYSYRVIERVAILGGVRYATLIPIGSTPDWAVTPGGFRIDVGLIWHH